MEFKTLQKNRGNSILEIVLAMAIFTLIGSAMISLAVGGFIGLEQGGEHTEAKFLGQEGIDALHSIRDRAWNEFTSTVTSSSNGLTNIGDSWDFSGTSETIGQFTRTIAFNDVCRDGSDDITVCPGIYTDPHIKEAVVNLLWTIRDGVTNTVENVSYISNWDSISWTQTDWVGGAGQTTWSSDDEYNSDDGSVDVTTAGQIILATAPSSGLVSDSDFEGSTETGIDWPFNTSSNYTFDSGDIEVTGGQAQLMASGGSTDDGDTLNDSFDTDASNWTYNDWEEGGGDPDATGSYQSSGGNPGGYVDVNLPSNLKNKTLGGFWEQSFTTTVADPDVTCEIDWKAFATTLPPQGVDDLFVAVYLDSASGEPTKGTEVLKKDFTNTFDWESHSGGSAFDCSSSVSAIGTYYYKVAVWIDATNKDTGPINVGFDNAKVHWEKVTGGTYPSDEPSINPITSYTEAGVLSWDSFTETATKNGGEIYYQLSDDDGSTWKYWNGSAWANVSIATDYNIASVVNTNIGDFSVTSGKVMFKAFLKSDGSQFVRLDNINIGFAPASSAWSFSMWDAGGGEVDPTGTRQISGGNSDGYADIDIPSNAKGDTVGGFWEQEIEVSSDGETLICEFDWEVSDWTANYGVDDNQLYVFLDTSSGDPTIGNEIWSSGTLSGTVSWGSESFDCSSAAATSGTYYLKVAQWLDAVDKNTGPITVGYDNVEINSSAASYETSGTLTSSAYDTGASSKIQVIEWDEILPVGVYDIQFQIRTATTEDGLASAEWSGPEGKDGDETDFFTSGYGELIHIDHNGDQWIQYKFILSGDGDDTPTLEEIRINYK